MDEISEGQSSSRLGSESQARSAAIEVPSSSDSCLDDSQSDSKRPQLLRAELSEDEEKAQSTDLTFEDPPAQRAATQKQGARRTNRLRQARGSAGGQDIIGKLISGQNSEFAVFNDKIERLRHGHSSSSGVNRRELSQVDASKAMQAQGLKQRQRFVLSAKNQFTKQQQLI